MSVTSLFLLRHLLCLKYTKQKVSKMPVTTGIKATTGSDQDYAQLPKTLFYEFKVAITF